jgi:hypothetical protein
MVWVLTCPRKKNRPCVQSLIGTIIDTSTLWPGASTPPDGLNTIFPGTLVKPVQCKLLVAVALSVTFARQVYAPFLFVQSRCPTKLIDDGRKSRIGGIDTGGAVVGCGVWVATGVGLGVDIGVGVNVTTGVTAVAVAVGAAVGTVVGVAWFVCPVAAEPQEARAITAIARLQKTSTILFLFVFPVDG